MKIPRSDLDLNYQIEKHLVTLENVTKENYCSIVINFEIQAELP